MRNIHLAITLFLFQSLLLINPIFAATPEQQAKIMGLLGAQKCRIRNGLKTVSRSWLEKVTKEIGLKPEILDDEMINKGAQEVSFILSNNCSESRLNAYEVGSLIQQFIRPTTPY